MSWKQYAIVVVWLATVSPAVAQERPPPAPLGQAYDRALEDLRLAPDERAARDASRALWRFWAAAPDAKSQATLDEGMAAMRQAAFGHAIAVLTELVAYCPDYAEGYNQRAFAYFLTTRFEEALADLDRTLELSPRHVAAISGRGLTLIQLGRDAEGQAALRRALRMHPFMPERRYLTDEPETEL